MCWIFWKKLACQDLNQQTLMDPNVKLYEDQEELLSNPERYHCLVGKLNYLTITHPDMSFVGSYSDYEVS